MADYYLDTDVIGGTGDGSSWANAFASLSAAVSGLTISEDSTLNCRGAAADTTSVILNGMGADTYTLTIKGDWPGGTYSTSRYRLESTSRDLIQSEERKVTFDHLQFKMGNTGSYLSAIDFQPGSAVGTYTCNVLDCIVDGNGGRGVCLFAGSGAAGSTFNVERTIIYDIQAGSTSSCAVTGYDSDVAVTVDHCTVYNFGAGRGLRRGSTGSFDVTNTLVFKTPNDFDGTFTSINYCASDDGDGTNAVTITQTANDYAALVTDAPGGDFSPTDGSSQLVGADSTGGDIGAIPFSSTGPIQQAVAGVFSSTGSLTRKVNYKRTLTGAI